MNIFKTVKRIALSSLVSIIIVCILIFLPIIAVVGVVVGSSNNDTVNYTENLSNSGQVRNNFAYAKKYKNSINKYLKNKGYVSLERVVFYLQHTNNMVDVSSLEQSKWDDAYLKNINEEQKQMIPIAEICKNINTNLGVTHNGKYDVINLCVKEPLTTDYQQFPFSFPLKTDFVVTSFTNEQRVVYGKSNTHNGWDLAVPIGTKFYSICDGTISNVVNTQKNDKPYDESHNEIGNYVTVKCNNNTSAIYYHIKYKSTPFKKGDTVSKGEFLGLTSTTGYSTGPHLHLGLKNSKGDLLDPMDYIDMKNWNV